MAQKSNKRTRVGFTIVELMVAIAVIGILAGIVIVSVDSWRTKVARDEVTSDLNGVKAAMENARNFSNGYPSTIPSGFKPSKNVNVTVYSSTGNSYCINASSKSVGSVKYFIDVDTNGQVREPMAGDCVTGEAISGTVVAGWSDMSVSVDTMCGVVNSRAYCAGKNFYGEVGDNSTTQRNSVVPVNATTVLSGKKITDISAGADHTCALSEGKVYCWGRNAQGQLGTGNNTNSSYPVAVSTSGVLSGKTVTAISSGSFHTCAIATNLAYCWGSNTYGQLGNGSTTSSNAPVAVTASGVLSGKSVAAISAGEQHSCAIATNLAYCWGGNGYGQIGDNSFVQKQSPVAVDASGVLAGKTITAISAGARHTCALATSLAYCWGYNANGQLGDNTLTQKQVPTAVYTASGLSGKTVTKIDTNLTNTCALASGLVYCWGLNTYGQIGDGTMVQKQVPTAVTATGVLSGKTLTSVKVGGYSACATTSTENFCWGFGGSGQLGRGSTTSSTTAVQATNP